MGKSRAEYFKKRRQAMGQFYTMIDKELMERLDKKLKAKGMTRTAWLLACIDHELNEEGR